MDETRLAEAKQKLREVAVELAKASEAAEAALAASASNDNATTWKHLQQLYTRFDEASQLLRDMRRAVDAGLASR
ncbi:MAG: hypothetical protein ACOZQL_42735 [Myxococcota bacterium]